MKNGKLSVAYRAEMFRLLKSKSIWVFFIIMTVIVLLLLTVLSNSSFVTDSYNTWSVPEDIDKEIAELDKMEAEYSKELEYYPQDITINNQLYNIKVKKAVYNYFKDNGITEGTYQDFLISQTDLNIEDVYDYASYAISIAVGFTVLFYGSVAAGSIAGEKKNGTLKISLLRPVNRKDIISAKFLAYFTCAAVTLIAEFFVATVFGLIVADGFMTPVIMVFNATGVSVVNPFVALLIILLFGLIFIAIMIMGAIFVGVICNGKVPAVLFFLFLICGVFSGSIISLISTLIFNVDLAGFLPINACDLTICFMATKDGIGTVIPYIFFAVIYAVTFTVLSYILFNRQDN